MKALQLKDIGSICIEEIPVPRPRKGQVLMKVKSSALCRTDVKMWKMGHRDLMLPRVLGHECCAIREDNGRRYVIWPGNACGHCGSCRTGYENLCDAMQILGFHQDGGLAEYTVVSESSLVPVPDNLSDDLASLAEPLACTINALKMADIQDKQKVLIYGAGPVGLMMAYAAKIKGVVPTICEINPEKINLSRVFQNKTGIRVTDRVFDEKFDGVINAAPALEIFKEGIGRLQSRGGFCIFSGFTDTASAVPQEIIRALNDIHYRQLRISGAYGCTREQMGAALEILHHHGDDLSLLIEKTISIDHVPEVLPRIWSGKALKYVVILG